MAVFRKIDIRYWQDGYILNISYKEKCFYIYLMTNSKTAQCGIFELPKKIIEVELGLDKDDIEMLLKKFINDKKILYSEGTNEIMIINWIKYNGSMSPRVIERVISELKSVKNKEFVEKYLDLSNALGYKINRAMVLGDTNIDTNQKKN